MKIPPDVAQKSSRGKSHNIARKNFLPREDFLEVTLIPQKIRPRFQFHDGILSKCSHPGVAELTVYRQFYLYYRTYIISGVYNSPLQLFAYISVRAYANTPTLHTPHTFNIKYFVSNKKRCIFANYNQSIQTIIGYIYKLINNTI